MITKISFIPNYRRKYLDIIVIQNDEENYDNARDFAVKFFLSLLEIAKSSYHGKIFVSKTKADILGTPEKLEVVSKFSMKFKDLDEMNAYIWGCEKFFQI